MRPTLPAPISPLTLALLALTALFAAGPAAGEVVVETLEGPHQGKLVALDGERVTLETSGERKTIDLKQVVEMSFTGKAQPSGQRTLFRLASGDRYFGKLVDCDSVDSYTIDTPSCGRVVIGGSQLTLIRYPLAADKAAAIKPLEPGEGDAIVLRDGDRARGRLGDLVKRDGGGFTFVLLAGNDELELDDTRIYEVHLEPLPDEAPDGPSFHAVLECWDGTTFSARIRGFADRVVEVETLAGGRTLRVPLASLSSIYFSGGRFVYLSDLKWARKEVVPYFTFAFEPRIDRSRRGTPLTLRGRTYRRGIGMQSKTRLTYAVEGFASFRAKVGVDDLAGDGGSVVFRVYLDGKVAKETKVLRGGGEVVQLAVELKGAKELTIEADYADNAHVNDLANWVSPILIR